jgi:hypothetical protein
MSILKILKKGLCTSFLIWSAIVLSAQTPSSREYQVKAIFLFNFTQFVEWPANAFPAAQTPLEIGILGQDPFGSYLDQTISGEKANGHSLLVRRYHDIDDVKTCHILFISKTEENNMEEIVAALKGRNILTVSDAGNFIQQGGMIRFITVNNKIKLQINPEAAKAAGLTISSKLLTLAEIVVPK